MKNILFCCFSKSATSVEVGEFKIVFLRTYQHSGHYMYQNFNILQFYVLPTQYNFVFCVDLRTNSDYFPIQH